MNAPAKTRELPEFVDDLVRIGVTELVTELGTAKPVAEAVMARIAAGIVNQYARATMYVPAGFGTRNAEIWRKYCEPSPKASAYSRDRVEELAAEYELTSRQVYNIIAAMRAQDQAARYPRLPGFDDPA